MGISQGDFGSVLRRASRNGLKRKEEGKQSPKDTAVYQTHDDGIVQFVGDGFALLSSYLRWTVPSGWGSSLDIERTAQPSCPNCTICCRNCRSLSFGSDGNTVSRVLYSQAALVLEEAVATATGGEVTPVGESCVELSLRLQPSKEPTPPTAQVRAIK